MLAKLADPDSPDLRASRANVRHLRENLRRDETIVVLAGACDRRFRLGLLAATDERLLFVRQPLVGRNPIVISLPFSEIESVHWELEPLTGTLQLAVRDKAVGFTMVQPKERTWPLWWAV